MTYSEKYADFLLSLKLENIPESVINKAKELMIDTIGTALAGSQQETVKYFLDGISSLVLASGDYQVWGRTDKLSPEYAAMINGISSHILDFDDTHTEAILHGSAIFTPLCLTYGFSQCKDGKKIIKAFIAAWEIAARVGKTSNGSFHERGFHSTAISGIFGAVAAMAIILDLNQSQIINAFGIAGSFASGINEFLSNGSNSKVLHIANTIQNSILIAHLSKAGITGPKTVFEGRDNIFKCFGIQNNSSLDKLDEGLGTNWEISNVSIKPYPCCHFAHGLIDCMKAIRENGIIERDIAKITCFVDPIPISFICSPLEQKQCPQTEYEAKFSMPFLLSLMFFDGKITLDSYKDLNRPEVLALAKKISYQERTSCGFPKYFPGHLEVTLVNGEIIRKDIFINKGNSENPLSKEELEYKFLHNVENIVKSPLHVFNYIYSLEEQSSMIDFHMNNS
ncbi:MAG: MmgE/PrpD family protein [[Pasteurella] mairii]|uniref:MmgE/PrpD family n=1 Tax=[Pasteurella] mairii TaxID=757 RepID=A0A379B7F6_9PAST|nr:MmgE/PrpD family protein [[Pasteurella] mairii]SUB34585.1 MmgE/PrpD family [[Pasteurella] mairii]